MCCHALRSRVGAGTDQLLFQVRNQTIRDAPDDLLAERLLVCHDGEMT